MRDEPHDLQAVEGRRGDSSTALVVQPGLALVGGGDHARRVRARHRMHGVEPVEARADAPFVEVDHRQAALLVGLLELRP